MTYPEMVQMFRQSFEPLDRLGAGRLQLAQQQEARTYAEQQAAARRAAALQDAVTGMMIQEQIADRARTANEQVAARDREARFSQALELEGQRLKNSIRIGKKNARANERSQRRASEANALERRVDDAMRGIQQYQLKIDPSSYDDPKKFVNDTTRAIAEKNRGYVEVANKTEREMKSVRSQIDELSKTATLSEADQAQIVRGIIATSADVSDEDREKFAKGKLSDKEIITLAGKRGQDAIATAQRARTLQYEKAVQPLRDEMRQKASFLEALATRRGIFADPSAIIEAPAVQPVPTAPTGQPQRNPLEGAIQPLGTGADIPRATAGETIEAMARYGAPAAASTLAVQSLRPSSQFSPFGPAPFGPSLPGQTMAGRMAAMGPLRAAAGPVGWASLINDAPTAFGYDPLAVQATEGVMRMTGTDFEGELGRQREALATIDGLVRQASARGDHDLALRINALKAEPQITSNSEEIMRRAGAPGYGGGYIQQRGLGFGL